MWPLLRAAMKASQVSVRSMQARNSAVARSSMSACRQAVVSVSLVNPHPGRCKLRGWRCVTCMHCSPATSPTSNTTFRDSNGHSARPCPAPAAAPHDSSRRVERSQRAVPNRCPSAHGWSPAARAPRWRPLSTSHPSWRQCRGGPARTSLPPGRAARSPAGWARPGLGTPQLIIRSHPGPELLCVMTRLPGRVAHRPARWAPPMYDNDLTQLSPDVGAPAPAGRGCRGCWRRKLHLQGPGSAMAAAPTRYAKQRAGTGRHPVKCPHLQLPVVVLPAGRLVLGGVCLHTHPRPPQPPRHVLHLWETGADMRRVREWEDRRSLGPSIIQSAAHHGSVLLAGCDSPRAPS